MPHKYGGKNATTTAKKNKCTINEVIVHPMSLIMNLHEVFSCERTAWSVGRDLPGVDSVSHGGHVWITILIRTLRLIEWPPVVSAA